MINTAFCSSRFSVQAAFKSTALNVVADVHLLALSMKSLYEP